MTLPTRGRGFRPSALTYHPVYPRAGQLFGLSTR
nr:MAG TPA: hypothetical protein [Caudoviricetes sp.]